MEVRSRVFTAKCSEPQVGVLYLFVKSFNETPNRRTLWHHFYELNVANNKLRSMARHDDLTGLKNRRSIKEISNSFNAVIFLDLDDFKKLNDTYDHDCGDEISREFATRGSQAIREEDILIRWGGEEFIVLLNVLSEKDAMIICERIQTSVRQVFEYEDLKLKVTCSIGLAIDLKDHVKDIHQLINRADQAMYDSK